MCPYIYDSSLSYKDYLQVQSFRDEMKSDIEEETRKLISSNEEINEEQIRAIENYELAFKNGIDSISQGLSSLDETLSYELKNIDGTLRVLNSTFNWGFSEVLSSLGSLSDNLDRLIQIAKTPNKTWAYEQYKDAHDAFRQELYPEALEFLDRAINGDHNYSGYKLDHRFYFLKGTILLGSFRNNSLNIINLYEAEITFLKAARYAKKDYPNEAAHAFLSAGWASYCQGNIESSFQKTKDALSYNPNLAEAYYQTAKIEMHRDNVENGIEYLKKATSYDSNYILKAAKDGDFKKHGDEVNELIENLRDIESEICAEILTDLKENKENLDKLISESKNNISDKGRGLMSDVESLISLGSEKFSLNTFFSCIEAKKYYKRANKKLDECIQEQKNELERVLEEERRKRKENEEKRIEEEKKALYTQKKDEILRKKSIVKSIGMFFEIIIGGVGGGIIGVLAAMIIGLPIAFFISLGDATFNEAYDSIGLIFFLMGGIIGIFTILNSKPIVRIIERKYENKIMNLNKY